MNKSVISFPPCFDGPRQWSAYLSICQSTLKRERERPYDGDGQYRPQFNFCRDCERSHAESMAAAGRCNPAVFRGVAVVVA